MLNFQEKGTRDIKRKEQPYELPLVVIGSVKHLGEVLQVISEDFTRSFGDVL